VDISSVAAIAAIVIAIIAIKTAHTAMRYEREAWKADCEARELALASIREIASNIRVINSLLVDNNLRLSRLLSLTTSTRCSVSRDGLAKESGGLDFSLSISRDKDADSSMSRFNSGCN